MKLSTHPIRLLCVIIGMFSCILCHADNKRLWYQQPAEKWLQAIPIGNGRLSAMIYGGEQKEIIALNEISMWAGQHDPTSNDLGGKEALAQIRKALLAGDLASGDILGNKHLNGRMTSFGTHVPLGNLIIDFDLPESNSTEYIRALDLSKAVASVDFKNGGISYHREYIADYPDNVIAMRYTSSQKNKINATLSLDLLQKATIKTDKNELTLNGSVEFPLHGPGGVDFFSRIKVIPEGGSVTYTDSTISISNADAMTIILDIRTDYDDINYITTCNSTMAEAEKKSFDTLRNRHIADYSNLYNRMSIRLGNDDNSTIPTDLRLKAIAEGYADTDFDAMFFQYGRYMLISSSRDHGMPLCANLQGIWNDNGACNMSWTCDYHLDINTQQNYWSANRTNLAECNLPLFGYLKLLAHHGRETAEKVYGCRGWTAHTMCNAWGYTAPGGSIYWGLNVSAGAWLATHLWIHYQYTLDKEYLRNIAYPILRESALFFSDYMISEPETGYLLTGPSISPENGYIGNDGHNYSLAMMPTIDRTMVYDIYNACIKSAEILGIDDEFTRSLRHDINLLPPLKIGSDGALQEWYHDVKRSDPSHRHSSHLHGLFPLDHISYTRNPELIESCRKSLVHQTSSPNWEDTEWSTTNMICFRARTKDREEAYRWLQNLFQRFMRDNLMTVSPAGVAGAQYDIFSFDATEGAVAGMCEMLLQSYDGFIEFLPALPSQWQSGEVTGLCAQNGLIVDMSWDNGKMSWARIYAAADDRLVNIKGLKNSIKIRKGASVKIKF